MQVSMISRKGVEVDPSATTTSTPDGTGGDTGFAAMLSALLAQMRESGSLVPRDAPDEVAAEPVEATTTPTDNEADATPIADSDDDATLATAMAMAAAVSAPSTPSPPLAVEPVAVEVPSETQDSPTSTVLATTPTAAPANTTPPSESFVAVDATPVPPQATAPTDGELAGQATKTPPPSVAASPSGYRPAPTLESRATYAVLPSYAPETIAVAPKTPTTQVAPTASEEANAKAAPAEAALPISALSTATAEVVDAPRVALAASTQTPLRGEASLRTAQAPTTMNTDADDLDLDVDSVLPAGTAHTSNAKAADTESPESVLAAPAPERGPVLEKHTVTLARNALNEQLKGSSARELLAGAREADTPAEKATETPATVFAAHDPGRQVPLRSVASSARHDTVTTSSLPTLGDDLVKQVTLHAGPGERTLTMRLVPESLGEVQVELTSNAQTISVRLVSADAQVREALQQHANGLREALLRDGRDAHVEIGSQLANQLGQGNLAQGNDGWSGRHTAQQDAQDRARFASQAFFLTEPQAALTGGGERQAPVHQGALNLLA